jgi:hypothetical protein
MQRLLVFVIVVVAFGLVGCHKECTRDFYSVGPVDAFVETVNNNPPQSPVIMFHINTTVYCTQWGGKDPIEGAVLTLEYKAIDGTPKVRRLPPSDCKGVIAEQINLLGDFTKEEEARKAQMVLTGPVGTPIKEILTVK